MGEHSEVFVAFDTAKLKHAVALAEGGRDGEVRFLGEVENRPAAIEKVIKKLAWRYRKLHVCFEAGPTGALPADAGAWPRLPGGGASADPKAIGGAREDEPA